MKKTRLLSALAAIVFLNAGVARAQAAPVYESLVGRWSGSVDTPQGAQEVQLAVDSSEAGLHGSAYAPQLGTEATAFSVMSIKADTIMLTLPVQGVDVTFSGWINPETHFFEGDLYVGPDNAGSFSFKRVPPAGKGERSR